MKNFVYRLTYSTELVYRKINNVIHKTICGLQNIHKLFCGSYLRFQYPQTRYVGHNKEIQV